MKINSEDFRVTGKKVKLKDFDPNFAGRHEKKQSALPKVEERQRRMDELQFRLYADQRRSLLICLQAPDAGGKDCVVRHVIASMNPQGCRVVSFKQPSPVEFSPRLFVADRTAGS